MEDKRPYARFKERQYKRTTGSKYTGTFSEDGNILSGGWRPEEGTKKIPENTYDATMTRVNKKSNALA